ncbi:hypothetical protein AAMO2058_000666200 [Amorphochlora amoebiformis]
MKGSKQTSKPNLEQKAPETETKQEGSAQASIQSQPVQGTPNEAKLGLSETKSDSESEIKRTRIVVGLKEMLSRFTVSENMYVELAGVVERDYPTNRERVEAVQRILSEWKEAGVLRLRTDALRRQPVTN